MARDPLGIFIADGFVFAFAVLREKKGLNFLTDSSLYSNPANSHKSIGPRPLVDWSDND